MKPIKIRYYGVLPLTRSQYLLATFWLSTFLLGFMLTLALLAAERFPPFHWPWEPLDPYALPGWRGVFLHHFYSIMALFLLFEVIDIMVTLRKFRVKEREMRERNKVVD
jgi:hypothetical protein